jgi:glycosyltransferase involved in cell wall biosynthesis
VKKELILHVIDSLTTGGAEMLLKNTVNELKDFRHVVVYLNKPDTLRDEFEGEVEFICLGHKRRSDLLFTILKLRNVVLEKKPLLVHSHLQTSSICARIATPGSVSLLATLHSSFGKDAFEKSKKSILVERFTLRRRHILIAVSNYVLKDYLHFVPFKGKRFVLHNFLPDQFFSEIGTRRTDEVTKCVSVGNLKEAKNYHYLLNIFSKLKGKSISLDIYGEGNLREELQKTIDTEGLYVKLCGHVQDTRSIFKNYDLFIQGSVHEGFGISVIEAMASKIPILVTDIPVFKEITGENAHFIPLNDGEGAANILANLSRDQSKREKFVEDAFRYCRMNYSATVYKEKLLCIYNTLHDKVH